MLRSSHCAPARDGPHRNVTRTEVGSEDMHCATNGPGGVEGTLRIGGGGGTGVAVGRGVGVRVGVAASAGEAPSVDRPTPETTSVAVAQTSAIDAAMSKFL